MSVSDHLAELGLLDDAALFGAPLMGRLSGLALDSRQVQPGNLFAAFSGSSVHGVEFAPNAVHLGAGAILTDGKGMEWLLDNNCAQNVPIIVSKDPRRAFALAAARWYAAQPECVVAVTGTNGKTSVTTFLRQIWRLLGLRAVNFGTTGIEGDVSHPLAHTTPDTLSLHKLMSGLKEQGITHVAMEASSHGLDQRRLDGVRLTAAGFTHLSRDHLDYHETMERYADAKLGLFRRVLPEGASAVVNAKDLTASAAADLARMRGCSVLSVGENGCDIALEETIYLPKGQRLRFVCNGQRYEAELSLIGAFQVENILLAAGLAIASGCAAQDVFAVLHAVEGVRGRMQYVGQSSAGGAIYVDYAHTPDGLATALQALRPHVAGRLIVVFGAGGDRDPGKRPLMGSVAAAHADMVIVTDDNPRTEAPDKIRAAVLEGCPHARAIPDRADAIEAGVNALQTDDVLLIAGKGHETGQIIGQKVLPFDDAEQALIAINASAGADR